MEHSSPFAFCSVRNLGKSGLRCNRRSVKKRAASLSRHTVVFLLTGLVACGGGSDGPTVPPTPPVLPTKVVLVEVTPTSYRVRNEGGPGMYRVEAWGRVFSNTPSGCFASQQIDGRCPVTAVKVYDFEPVTVLAAYDETISFSGVTGGEFYGYKVFSRPQNTAAWTETGCKRAVTGGWLTFPC